MPYERYSEIVEVAECDRYVGVENINQLITTLNHVKFALQSERTKALEALADLAYLSHFYNNTSRFPEFETIDNKQYRFCVVDLDKDGFPAVFEQIESALQYKAPDIAGTNKDLSDKSSNYQSSHSNNNKGKGNNQGDPDDANTCITNMSERDRFEKALKSFTTGKSTLLTRKTNHTLTRRSFESRYSLVWKD